MGGRQIPKIFQQTQTPGTAKLRGVTAILDAPIIWLHADWSDAEQTKILSILQNLTDDNLRLDAYQVFTDRSGSDQAHRVGRTVIRGLQRPGRKVIIKPSADFFPSTSPVGSDAIVNIPFGTSGGMATDLYYFFTGSTSGGPGSVDRAPDFIILGHELVHAYHIMNGMWSGSAQGDNQFSDPEGHLFVETVGTEELVTVGVQGSRPYTENSLRAEHGLGSRLAYACASYPLTRTDATNSMEPEQHVRPTWMGWPWWWPQYPCPGDTRQPPGTPVPRTT